MTTDAMQIIKDFTLEEKTNLYILADCYAQIQDAENEETYKELAKRYEKHKRSILSPLTKEKRDAALEFLDEVKQRNERKKQKDLKDAKDD